MLPPNPLNVGATLHLDAVRARERALRLLESVEDLTAEILLSASVAQSRAADEAARLAADAEHAVIHDIGADADGVAATLVRVRRRLRVLLEDIADTRSPAPPHAALRPIP